jgi:hypothetical protein
VCSRSSDVVNHQCFHRDQHKTNPKQRSVPVHPHAATSFVTSQKSNWASAPGAVSIGTDAARAALNRGPRLARTARTTVAYDPSNPSAFNASWIDVDNNDGCALSSSAIRRRHRSVNTTRSAAGARRSGGPPALIHFAIVVR